MMINGCRVEIEHKFNQEYYVVGMLSLQTAVIVMYVLDAVKLHTFAFSIVSVSPLSISTERTISL